MIPGVRFEARECNCLENSEWAARAGCTDNTTWLERYAILATVVVRCTDQLAFNLQSHKRAQEEGQGGGHTCFTNGSYRSHIDEEQLPTRKKARQKERYWAMTIFDQNFKMLNMISSIMLRYWIGGTVQKRKNRAPSHAIHHYSIH